jgi:lipopolysaccharide/colanic/teichoic acid biosynthesis glycosyltransferase
MGMRPEPRALRPAAVVGKRAFDLVAATLGLALVGWVILLADIAARIDTGQSGLFRQARVGRHGRPFNLLKIRTMRPVAGIDTSVTVAGDARITPIGRLLRRLKIDELPQLWNVLVGQMSLVGPRPDVPGFADRLEGEDRIILEVRPGITGPASLEYRNEEALLAAQSDPEAYNRDVIWPDKVRINRQYVENWSFFADLRYIWRTILG